MENVGLESTWLLALAPTAVKLEPIRVPRGIRREGAVVDVYLVMDR